jgi:hypothetical protein
LQNEPWLTSALSLLQNLVDELINKNVEINNCTFLGFSQGACLTLEFVTRNAAAYGGWLCKLWRNCRRNKGCSAIEAGGNCTKNDCPLQRSLMFRFLQNILMILKNLTRMKAYSKLQILCLRSCKVG